ncbi:MAG: hypothetical protein A3C11_02530 [Candidatus Sungbacteria bacterium RIFCSPHIGHO2_02_FULL_49_12]|uniref:Uncharacterized protein n=1 Tax=Candidatus Sungbacteria bacterium RIFCSPHIGHO2_02_FULL_49_12 TaxID=1802271 RepID=A0A1G2KPZ2_9BACT|nr:MAG: hypothetical protein A3C11_02530 [Candidatus Sungbacteria bacterium RIFCSPHIGHO2_02_FULL_49_12]
MLLVLLLLFIASALGTGVIVVRKIPLVVATPREMVNDYFDQSSSRISIRMLRARSWIRQGSYWDPMLKALLRIVGHLRIWLLRLDRYLSHLYQSVNKKAEARKAASSQENNPLYWDDLKSPKTIVEDIQKPERN